MNDSVEWGKSCPNVEVDNFRRDGVATLPLESLPGVPRRFEHYGSLTGRKLRGEIECG